MPPLEDFVLAGQPGAIGTSSVIAVIIGGLFLLYRGVLDYRIPLLVCVSAFAALLVLPIPSVIADAPHWRWAALRQPDIGWAVAITFANYEIMASPLIFMAFFLATSPSVRPMTRRGRTIYALLLGASSAALQLYLSVSYGPYFALLIVSLLTPALDRLFKVRPLV
jgi:electron transport complex protein RnfD